MTAARFFSSLLQRQSLMQGLATGVLALGVAWLVPHLDQATRWISAWDMGLVVFLASLWRIMSNQTPASMREWSMKLQASRNALLLFASVTATAALLSLFIEMRLAKAEHGLVQVVRIAFLVATVSLSWFFLHAVFALDYAHEFFAEDAAGQDRGGLKFPGDEPPDFWDFLHFAVIIGVASQTADISITSKPMRRLGTIHSLISFSFNTVILALTINLAAGLLGS